MKCRHWKTTLLSIATFSILISSYGRLEAAPSPDASVIEKFRSDDYISLGTVLGTLSKLNLEPIHKGEDLLLKGRELMFIEKAGDKNICNGSNGSWIEAINFEVGDHAYQLNVLASAQCHKVDLKPLFVGSSVTTPELFYDVAYPSVHDRMYSKNMLDQKFQTRDAFLENVTVEIRKLHENTESVVEEWTVHHQDKKFMVQVKFSHQQSGKYGFSLI